MPNFSLADIQQAAETKYGDLSIDLPDGSTAVLRNGLRLPKEERREVQGLQSQIDALQSDDEAVSASARRDDEDQTEAMTRVMRGMIALVVRDKATGTALLSAIGEDPPALIELLQQYGQVSQPGEA